MKLYHGDCLEEMKKIKDSSVDIIIADLPYGRFKHLEWDKALVLETLWKQIWRVSKKNTPVFLFGDMKFGVELINSCPKFFKYEIVWNKNKTTTPLLSRKRLGKATEYIFIFYKHQPVYNYQKYHKVKFVEQRKTQNVLLGQVHCKKSTIINYDPRLPLNVVHTACSNKIIGGEKLPDLENRYKPRLPLNILECKKVERKKLIKNITEKPQFLLEFLLKYFSNEGDICLDMTMGSGSCGEACATLKRNFIGIELIKEHYDIAKKRLDALI
jgi:DNA modification methylase